MISQFRDVKIRSDHDRLILLIRQLGLKQYEFARELGYTPSYLESIINGRSPFTNALKKRIDIYLMNRQKEKEYYEKKMYDLS